MLRLSFVALLSVPNIEFIDMIDKPNKSQLIVDDCVIEVYKDEISNTEKMIELVETLCFQKTSVESN